VEAGFAVRPPDPEPPTHLGPRRFGVTFCRLAGRAVKSGRRVVAGQEWAKEVLSAQAQQTGGFVVEKLPNFSTLSGNPWPRPSRTTRRRHLQTRRRSGSTSRAGSGVTQLPQHLPRQVFGLVNSYLLHKTTDADVVSTLRRTVSGIDAGLWDRLPGLAPGQTIVSFPHMARPLLVSIDPTPAKLRLVD